MSFWRKNATACKNNGSAMSPLAKSDGRSSAAIADMCSIGFMGSSNLALSLTPCMNFSRLEVAGFIFATVGVIYAVLLAFTVIIVLEQHLAAESAVSQEAAALITVVHDTSSFPEPARGQVHDQLRAYAQFVINDEWRTIDEGTLEREESRGALAAINTMWSIYRSLPPGQVDPHTTDSLDNLSAQRAIRLQSNVAALPEVLWFGLLFGG